jgi:cold shock CspA family protein
MRLVGYISSLNIPKGFGFIRVTTPGRPTPIDYFFHFSQLAAAQPADVPVGTEVSFDADNQYPKGPRAFNVTRVV